MKQPQTHMPKPLPTLRQLEAARKRLAKALKQLDDMPIAQRHSAMQATCRAIEASIAI